MADITIVGGGFSAYVAKSFSNLPVRLINFSGVTSPSYINIIRRKSLETNKLFLRKAKSFGALSFCLRNCCLHDRLIYGGNSSIWGGIVDFGYFSKNLIDLLLKKEIHIKPLSFVNTGTVSNNLNLGQLQDETGRIFDAASKLDRDSDFFLDTFFIDNEKICLKLISSTEQKIIYTNKLVLCTGVVQIIDLLYRSGFLKSSDRISLSEYRHKISFKFTLRPYFFSKTDSTIVRFDLFRAASHFFGIQKRLFFSRIFQYLPIYVDQEFFCVQDRCEFLIENRNILDLTSKDASVFGKSIHYCDMEINGVKLNKFLSEISSQLVGVGMAFVRQKKPGPISNDIVLDAEAKLR